MVWKFHKVYLYRFSLFAVVSTKSIVQFLWSTVAWQQQLFSFTLHNNNNRLAIGTALSQIVIVQQYALPRW